MGVGAPIDYVGVAHMKNGSARSLTAAVQGHKRALVIKNRVLDFFL